VVYLPPEMLDEQLEGVVVGMWQISHLTSYVLDSLGMGRRS